MTDLRALVAGLFAALLATGGDASAADIVTIKVGFGAGGSFAEIESSGEVELDPKTGDQMTAIIEKNLNADPAIIEALKAMVR